VDEQRWQQNYKRYGSEVLRSRHDWFEQAATLRKLLRNELHEDEAADDAANLLHRRLQEASSFGVLQLLDG